MASRRVRISRYSLILRGEFFAGERNDRRIRQQHGPFDAQFVEAGIGQVLEIRCELGRLRMEFAAAIAGRIELLASRPQAVSSISASRTRTCSDSNCSRPSRVSPGIAFGFELHELLGKLHVFFLTPRNFFGGRFHLSLREQPPARASRRRQFQFAEASVVAERWRSSSVATRADRCEVVSAARSRRFRKRCQLFVSGGELRLEARCAFPQSSLTRPAAPR